MKSNICCAALLAVGGAVAAQPSVVSALDCDHNVTYAGISRNGIEAFLGIPFGHDTSGENRFRPPRPYVFEPGSIVDATAVGPACPQDTSSGASLPDADDLHISEDCLSLNVVRPKGTNGEDRLPVMVWIYGGGLWAGRAQDSYSIPDYLVAQSVANGLPVIHVAMNYRLGIFGFAQNDALKAERSENAGLRDQRLALEWVQDNIKFFGGDAQRVTIFGQSSGGLSVGIQIMAYGGKRPIPFQQAICESQALEIGFTAEFTINAMRDVVGHLGIKSDLQSAETIGALRELDMEVLLDASIATYTDSVMDGDIWLPVVDGDFIPEAPSKLIETHGFGKVNVIMGWCQDDENLMTNTSIKTAEETRQVLANFVPHLTASNLDELLALYPSSEFQPGEELSAEFHRTSRIKRDMVMTCQPIHYGHHLAAAGNEVYLYNWNQTFLDKFSHALGKPSGLGVIHTSDLPYVYGNPDIWRVPSLPSFATDSDFKLADRASRTFSTFASLGNPGFPGLDTFQGFIPVFGGGGDDDINVFIAGGPNEGSSTLDGPGAKPQLGMQKLRERCGFLNTAEVIEQLRY